MGRTMESGQAGDSAAQPTNRRAVLLPFRRSGVRGERDPWHRDPRAGAIERCDLRIAHHAGSGRAAGRLQSRPAQRAVTVFSGRFHLTPR
jgi:hypothetical protein